MKHTKLYVVAGIYEENIGYLAFDVASGGYPYVSGVVRDMTHDISKAETWLSDANGPYVKLENPKVYEIVLSEVM